MKKNKKGYTLVEVILSVVLIALLLVPISGLIRTTFKSSKKADIKQEASIIGQQLLEELKSKDSISTTSPISLLDGTTLRLATVTANGRKYTENVSYNKQDYVIEVDVESTNFENYGVATNTVESTDDSNRNYIAILRLRTYNNTNQIKISGNDIDNDTNPWHNIPIHGDEIKLLLDLTKTGNSISIKLQDHANNQHNSYYGDVFIDTKNVVYTGMDAPKIKVILDDGQYAYTGMYGGQARTVNILVNNGITLPTADTTTPRLIMDVVKKKGATGKISFVSSAVALGTNTVVQVGTATPTKPSSENISIMQNITSGNNTEAIGNMYNITIVVKNNNEEVFRSQVNNNM